MQQELLSKQVALGRPDRPLGDPEAEVQLGVPTLVVEQVQSPGSVFPTESISNTTPKLPQPTHRSQSADDSQEMVKGKDKKIRSPLPHGDAL